MKFIIKRHCAMVCMLIIDIMLYSVNVSERQCCSIVTLSPSMKFRKLRMV